MDLRDCRQILLLNLRESVKFYSPWNHQKPLSELSQYFKWYRRGCQYLKYDVNPENSSEARMLRPFYIFIVDNDMINTQFTQIASNE